VWWVLNKFRWKVLPPSSGRYVVGASSTVTSRASRVFFTVAESSGLFLRVCDSVTQHAFTRAVRALLNCRNTANIVIFEGSRRVAVDGSTFGGFELGHWFPTWRRTLPFSFETPVSHPGRRECPDQMFCPKNQNNYVQFLVVLQIDCLVWHQPVQQ
jgi:hypothetical protein